MLAGWLAELGVDQRLAKLLDAHGDGSAALCYAAALLAFWQQGPGKRAGDLLKQACSANPHVPAYLLGRRPLPDQPPEYIGFGDEAEAEAYISENRQAWQRTSGALEWLASRT